MIKQQKRSGIKIVNRHQVFSRPILGPFRFHLLLLFFFIHHFSLLKPIFVFFLFGSYMHVYPIPLRVPRKRVFIHKTASVYWREKFCSLHPTNAIQVESCTGALTVLCLCYDVTTTFYL